MRTRLSLKYRIAIMIFLLEAVMMAFVLWQTLGQSLNSSREQFAANEQAMLGVVSGMSRIALLTEEYADLQPYLEEVLEDPRVRRVVLADVEGRIVASTQPKDVGMALAPILSRQDEKNLFWRSREITNAAGLLGELAIQFSNEALLRAYSRSRNLGVSIAAIGMGIIAVAGVLTGFLLTRRLERLTQAAGRIARGEPGEPVGLRGHDELAQLGQAFDTMALELAEERRRTARARGELEQRVEQRTAELAAANEELQTFSYTVSHDLRAPLRSMVGFSQALLEDYEGRLDETGKSYLQRVRRGAERMDTLIDDILELSRAARSELNRQTVDLSTLVQEIHAKLKQQTPERTVELSVTSGLEAEGDKRLLQIALDNLLGNAWKYTSKKSIGEIEFGVTQQGDKNVYYVKDNGAGFDMSYADKIFDPFQRLHNVDEFEGTGIGLATVQRIIRRHGGTIWAKGEVDQGATFYFTLGQ